MGACLTSSKAAVSFQDDEDDSENEHNGMVDDQIPTQPLASNPLAEDNDAVTNPVFGQQKEQRKTLQKPQAFEDGRLSHVSNISIPSYHPQGKGVDSLDLKQYYFVKHGKLPPQNVTLKVKDIQ
eukprot:152468_1